MPEVNNFYRIKKEYTLNLIEKHIRKFFNTKESLMRFLARNFELNFYWKQDKNYEVDDNALLNIADRYVKNGCHDDHPIDSYRTGNVILKMNSFSYTLENEKDTDEIKKVFIEVGRCFLKYSK